MKIVTVGCGMAAAEFVETLRQNGSKDEIFMISNEPFIPYSPCSMPFYASGEPIDTVFWKGINFYNKYNINPILGRPVTSISLSNKYVEIDGDNKITYDKLLYAPGSRSYFPDESWLNYSGVFGFKNLQDILSIDNYIKSEKINSAVVFGGGFIGIDAALSLWKRGLNVTVVHRNNRVLSQMTDQEGGIYATEKLREKTGINIILKHVVSHVLVDNGKLRGVVLNNGNTLTAELMVVTIGVTPNVEILGVKTKGVEVEDDLLFSDDVYVAGDVASTKHMITRQHGVYATYPNARAQARSVAYSILFNKNLFMGSLNTNVLKKHIEFPIISAGYFEGEAYTYSDDEIFRRIYIKDSKIYGYLLVGDTSISGFIYNLYISQKNIGSNVMKYLSLKRGKAYYIHALAC
jgi:nitrite reductase (NADH) large subunit